MYLDVFRKNRGGDYMLLDLKKVFLGEGERIEISFEFPLNEEMQARSFPKPVKADVLVRNRAGLVTLDADIEVEVVFNCDRCTAITSRVLIYHFEHILVQSLSEGNDDDYIEAPDYSLEIEGLLRDDVFLELPAKLLCRDDCKGLCQRCGKNLNDGECGCNKNEPDPRLAALKALLQ